MSQKSNKSNNGKSKGKSNDRGYSNNKRGGFNGQRESRNPVDPKTRGINIGDNDLSTRNDPQWHTLTSQILKDVASLPFSQMTGLPYNTVTVDGSQDVYRTPGICVLNWSPSFGISTDAQSPINVASRAIYSFVRHMNSGAKNYNSPDLMIYLAALAGPANVIAAAKRAYGLAMYFSPYNRYLGKALVESLGFKYDDIIGNPARFRTVINLAVNKLNVLACPKGMTYFDRQKWLNDYVWMDRPSTRAQFFVYRMVHTYKYVAMQGDKTYGRLEYIPLTETGSLLSIDDIDTILKSQLDTLLSDEDIGIMSGDILKAYGPSGLRYETELSEVYRTEPMFNDAVLEGIHNFFGIGMASPYPLTRDLDEEGRNEAYEECPLLSQDPALNILVSKPCFAYGYTYHGSKVSSSGQTWLGNYSHYDFDIILDFDNDSPSPELIIDSTRMIVDPNAIEAFDDQYFWFSEQAKTGVASEIPLGIHYLKLDDNPAIAPLRTQSQIVNNVLSTSGLTIDIPEFTNLAELSAFRRRPMFRLLAVRVDDDTNDLVYSGNSIYGDLDNTLSVRKDVIERMHSQDILAQFYAPGSATFNASK